MRYASLLFLGLILVNASEAKTVAVIVYAHDAGQVEKIVNRAAQMRVEQILSDNGVAVLDQEKSKELKKSWKMLENPGFLLTKEGFDKVTQEYDIDGICRVYLKTRITGDSEQFVTAIAEADLHCVNEDARLGTVPATPMETDGYFTPDGSTVPAAMINAVQRAVDSSFGKMGYKIDDAVVPYKINFELKQVDVAAIGIMDASKAMRRIPADPTRLPKSLFRTDFADATERVTDEATCLAQSPDNARIAVGIRVRTQYRHDLTWHSILRLVDVTSGNLANEWVVDQGMRYGTTRILDCMFINNWRYLAAVTGNTLVMWDTARGTVMSRIDLAVRPLESASLAYYRSINGWFLVVEGNNEKKIVFQFVVQKK